LGNGRAIALGAARQGAGVAVTDIDGGAAQMTADMAAETGVASYALTSDAADPDACETTVTWAAEVLGGLDALVLSTSANRLARSNRTTQVYTRCRRWTFGQIT
jgi:NAD(P)-dependent dehydrogenase (short-subunit alcohol dehydrogenase family)